jgi:hypothetical protein
MVFDKSTVHCDIVVRHKRLGRGKTFGGTARNKTHTCMQLQTFCQFRRLIIYLEVDYILSYR